LFEEVAMPVRTVRMLVLAVGLALVVVPTSAQPVAPASKVLKVEDYLNYETVADPQISPDGAQVVYTRRWVNRMEDRMESALWMIGADGSKNRFLTKGSNAVWSPDGTRIAYIAEGEPKGPQIFVRWMDAEGATSQVTQVDEAPADVNWSPDGKQLAFTMFVPKPAKWEIPMPKAPEGSKWTKAPAVIDRLHYRQDRKGYTEPGFVHLFVVPADGGTPRALTSGEWNVGARFDGLSGAVAWDWSPDGRTIVVDGLDESDADLRYRDSDIFAIEVATGNRRKLVAERGSWFNPQISPDGKLVAFVGYPSTKASYKTEELYVVGLDGTGMRKLSGSFDRDARNLQWAADGAGVYFTADDRGTSNIHFAPLSSAVRVVTTGTHMLSLSGPPARGIGVGVRSTPQQPPDVVRVNLAQHGNLTQLTRVNEDLLTGVTLGDVEEISYTSTGGTKVQGWLVKPPAFDKTRRYPLILEIHGGPHGMYNVGFNFMFQSFAANGYVVLYTNPRGSTGYGSAFGNAIERAYPSVDYDDLMAGVDATLAKGFVDSSNMFVGGCSGGGVLSSWVIGHTDRFAAAAVRCPVTNWLSFMGHTDIPFFTQNFFDAPFWEKPEQWLKQSSLMYVGNVKTPTLLMTGVLDMRTPMPQTEEYYTALKMRGVPTKLLRFEGEYHGTSSKPSNFMRTILYMVDWYKEHSRPAPTSTQSAR
jgi:dipeptidyl aminopeptidase/acylaminoacyl peptidase